MAIAPVYERTGRYVCSACGETRQRSANTIVSTEAELLQAFEGAPGKLGAVPLLASLLAAVGLVGLGRISEQTRWLSWFGALLVAFAFAHFGRRARQKRRVARGRRRYEIEQRIIGLAFCNDGLLSAALVSETLRITVMEAQELLGELVSTSRARAEMPADGGPTIYHFSEAKRTRGLRRSQSS